MKLEALKELAAKVEANELDAFWHENLIADAIELHRGKLFIQAFNGSLDAAKALHDAVLPGWDWSILSGVEGELVGVGMPRENFEPQYHGVDFSDNPARSWLQAILRALIAQEEGK